MSKFSKIATLLAVLLLIVSVCPLAVLAEEGGTGTEISSATEAGTIFEVIERGEGTLGERLAQGGKVMLLGLLIVFLVLIILMAVLYLFKAVYAAKQKKAVPSAPAASAVPAAAPAPASDPNEELTVAVAASAIAAARGESDCGFNIVSITKFD